MKKILLALLFVSFLNVTAQNPIQEFNFNGTLNNTANTTSFIGTENYVSDRSGQIRGAQRLTNKAMEAVIDNLPQGNSDRTVSVWVKFNDIAKANYIWGYGTAYNAQYCGLLQQGTHTAISNLSLAGWGASNDVILTTSLSKAVWYNYTITFDGKDSKIYRNGQLLKVADGISRDTKGNIFRLGEINTTIGINADIDDLKIYNVAMTEEQVVLLYDESKPLIAAASENLSNVKTAKSTAAGKIKVAATTNISSGISTTAIQSKNIEVFSKGEKVVGSNATTINDLPEGTYLLKITNAPSKKITSK